ncbi:MAG: response regulator [Pseudomonadota bacterium]
MKQVVIVDDDRGIRDAVGEYLTRHGLTVRAAEDASGLDALLAEAPADLIILDLMMPGEDGLSVCRRLGPEGPPILMLSALGETTDRIVGLEIGASDYLAKPFEPRELLARVRALLRLTERESADSPPEGGSFTFAGWTVDRDARHLLSPSGERTTLTAGELAVLMAFLERPQRLLTRDQLLDLARGRDAEGFDRAIDLAVSRLRAKLKPDGTRLIETVRGEGYRFTAKVEGR